MNILINRKRVLMLLSLPMLGFVASIVLHWLTNPAYTTSVNQSSLYAYAVGATLWSVCAISAGVFLYSKCTSMNHAKFILGLSSVLVGASAPWIVGA